MRGITAATLLRRFGLPVAVVIGAAALALLAAACRSGGGSSRSDPPQAEGGPTFPDPDSNGAIPKVTPQQLGVSSSQFQAAQTACEHLLKPNDAQVQLTLSGMLDFARCMRSHGVHDWPDPTTEDGQPVFDLQGRI